MEINFTPKNAVFDCSFCSFKCYKNSDWIRHISTDKHTRRKDGNKIELSETKKTAKYACKCGKTYSANSGLWKHSKTCNLEDKQTNIDFSSKEELLFELLKQNKDTTDKDQNIIMMLIKENAEVKNMMMEQQTIMMKVIENGTHNNNTTNSHNKAFNLNFFLNETCKDAMNITDFVDSIKLQLTDLERVGEFGFVDGISNIIIKNLKELDIEKRPVHCTDKKRETMYVKDENKWEKDEKNNKISKAIKRVVSKNQRLIPKFKEAHPDCNTYHSKYNDQYNKLIVESCGGSGDNDLEKEEKIIKNISKNVLVDK